MSIQLNFHIKTLQNNISILKSLFQFISENYKFPLDYSSYIELKEEDFKVFDSIAYRYLKTQSILGEKVFREILEFGEFNTQNKSFIEILAELQKEGVLENINEWQLLREIRNSISHDYPYDESEIIEAINLLYEKIEVLDKIVKNIKEKYDTINKIKSNTNWYYKKYNL